ncbi:hypothetical protein [Mycolicibacterium sp.]|uniref:WXG100 family type VII secretion target n=1 Tax=Mycolicibacterium sp. TaxID=2320850 RepID=UPI001A182978|nr:hypothetical protein [Mycolicibacterium sp.]MBJ7339788.1 hypothetical protein [Mycolicibacterium sp.]
MTRMVVDPAALAGAGRAVTGVGDEFASAVGTLTSSLGGGAPSGLDAAGLAFGMAYKKSAQALLDAGSAMVNASRNVGFGVGMSAVNYSQADAASTVGGGAAPLPAPDKPGKFDTPSCPSSLSGGVTPPFLWSVLENFIPDSWPDGNPGRLRASADAWQSFASTINGMAGELNGPSGVIGAQQIPEGGAMTSAMSELSQSLSGVATEAGNLATQIRDFADDVQSTQDAIRDLCDKISPSGIFDGIKAVFSGDALDEIKEIADDVQKVLENFGRQVDGKIALMQTLITALDDAVVSLQQGARREFTHYLGDDVGGALASAFEFQTNVGEGVLKAGMETVVGIQQLDPTRFASDFDGAKAAWGGVLDTVKYATPSGIAADPIGAFEHGKDMLGGIAHAEDWRADRPGLGLGGVLFEAGSAATGVGAAKTGLRGVTAAADAGEGAAAVRAVAGAADGVVPISGRAAEIAGKLDDLTTLADDVPSGATLGAHGPALPSSLAEPHVPRVPEAPRLPETPTPHGVPDSTGPRAVPEGPSPRPAEVPPQHVPEASAPHTGVSPQGVPDAGPPRVPGPAVNHSGAAAAEGSPAPTMSSASPLSSAPEPAMAGSGGGATHATETPPSGPPGVPHESTPHTTDDRPASSDHSSVPTDNGPHHPDDGLPHTEAHDGQVHSGEHSPLEAANSLNNAFVEGAPTSNLARMVAEGSTHYVGDVDRVVLGKWDGQDGGYIGEARHNGGIYFDTGDEVWKAVEGGSVPTKRRFLDGR